MGGNMSCLTRSSSQPKSNNASSPSSSSFIKSKRSSPPDHNHQTRRRYKEKQLHKNKTRMMCRDNSLTLDDSSSVGFRNPRRKIHPSSSSRQVPRKIHPSSSSRQVPRRLISEAKDSMCLDRPMMISKYKTHEEEEGKSQCLTVCKEEKRVRFKLPHVVILYSPDVEEGGHGGYYCNTTTREDSSSSFYLTMEESCRGSGGSSFESHLPDEFCFKLAVNTLPQASFSSGF